MKPSAILAAVVSCLALSLLFNTVGAFAPPLQIRWTNSQRCVAFSIALYHADLDTSTDANRPCQERGHCRKLISKRLFFFICNDRHSLVLEAEKGAKRKFALKVRNLV
jgi:hypothetical protein